MALLPLAQYQLPDHAGRMDVYSSWIAGLARRIRDTFDEMNYASTRATAMLMYNAPEPGDKAPDTYAEFLFRTARPTLHEPPARCR
jgi:hypothetical protein